ncbi:MAG: hypothetical protein EPN75_09360 [Beijerinckiaceae bacterium]|nr:MAG: hypothetical protein EPN75_09360 [Beijerinckiaceae bacterium]
MFKTASIFIVAATASLAIPVLPGAAQEAPAPIAHSLGGLCAQMGFAPDQLEYVYCVESLRESAGNLPLSHRSGYYALAAPMGGERYLAETSFYGGDHLVRESRACAGVGLPVGSQAFRQCVGNLDATILEIQNRALSE